MEDFEEYVLPIEYNHTPIRALGPSTRRKISQYLNLEGVLIVVGDIDLVNNFTGLAELIGFSPIEIRNIQKQNSPTEDLFDQWMVKERCENASVGNFWSFLYQLERFDVLQDCRRNILNDCRKYEDNIVIEMEAEKWRMEKQMEQDPRVTNSEMAVDETKVVSVDDVKTGQMTLYDAFICYESEGDPDRKFVREMIAELETNRQLKLFVPGRDDLPGAASNTINAYLIEKRCRRIVIIMSRAYWNSEICDFQTKFAQALAPGARSKKLIPVITEKHVQLPRILKFLAVCDFTKSDMKDWVWDRLHSAIIAPIPMFDDPDHVHSESSSLDELRHINFPIGRIRRLDAPDMTDQDSGYHGSASGSKTPSVSSMSSDTQHSAPINNKNDLAKSQTQQPHADVVTDGKKKSGKPKGIFSRLVGSKNKEPKKKAHSIEMKRDPEVAATRDLRSLPMARNRSDESHASYEHEMEYERNESVPINRGPVENVDLSRRISSGSMSTSPYGGNISARSSTSSRNSAECNEVTSSTGFPV